MMTTLTIWMGILGGLFVINAIIGSLVSAHEKESTLTHRPLPRTKARLAV